MNEINEITVVLGVLGVTVVLFIWNRLPVEMVALGASLTLLAAGVIDINQALEGFGDPTVVFIASLFVVERGPRLHGGHGLGGPAPHRAGR